MDKSIYLVNNNINSISRCLQICENTDQVIPRRKVSTMQFLAQLWIFFEVLMFLRAVAWMKEMLNVNQGWDSPSSTIIIFSSNRLFDWKNYIWKIKSHLGESQPWNSQFLHKWKSAPVCWSKNTTFDSVKITHTYSEKINDIMANPSNLMCGSFFT